MLESIEKVKTSFLFKHPFWAYIALNVKFIEKEDLGFLAATDCCKTVYYNPKEFSKLPYKQVAGVVLHELLHIIFMHSLRKGTRNHQGWNIATDYAINSVVIAMDYLLPKGCLLNDAYKGKTAEEIYDLLLLEQGEQTKENGKKEQGQSPCSGQQGFDDLLPFPEDGGAGEQHVKEMIAAAHTIHQMAEKGDLPGGLEVYIKNLLKPKVHWQRELARYAGETLCHEEYSYRRFNRQYLPLDILAPTLNNLCVGNVVIAVDTSGSMTTDQLTQFGAEIRKLATLADECVVITADAEVHQVIKTRDIAGFLAKMTFKGRGGTDHRPVFEKIIELKLQPELFIGLTDGDTTYPEKAPGFNVLWCLTKENKTPWGRQLVIE